MASKAIGTLTLTAADVKGANDALYVDEVSFPGPADYAGDGLSGLQAALRTKVGDQREILGVIQIGPCGGYSVSYDKANSVLRLYELPAIANGGEGAQPMVEAATVDLHLVTFKLLVFSK